MVRWILIAVAIGLFGVSGSFAQTIPLDQDCTVTVGNQTAQVLADGKFRVRNIAIFRTRDTGIAPQLYRLRATCLRGGALVTGQSDFFTLEPGETIGISEVTEGVLSPIPVGLSASAPDSIITLDETIQLSISATFDDASTEDRTLRSTGTTYLTSNPNLLTVSQDGLVTGTNEPGMPQTGTIFVLNEGNVASIEFTSTGPNDPDADGIPTEWELLFGLDPKNPADAATDPDADGLTMLDEYLLGTLPNNADTDGDGYRDGNEIAGGSDPLDPLSLFVSDAVSVLSIQNTVYPGDLTGLAVSSEVTLFNAGFLDPGLAVSAEVTLFNSGLPDPGLVVSATVSVSNATSPEAAAGETFSRAVTVENTAPPPPSKPPLSGEEP
ncbi:MAG: hypothetical protein GY716_13560 [bacterium]|nr:hypothetical protein [bacterium]